MAISESDVTYLQQLAVRRSGNVLTHKHTYLMESWLTPVVEELGLRNIEALVAELKRTPGRYDDQVAAAMTINETSFFRDVQPFEALRRTVIPALIQERSRTKQLIIWCGACSSGQEPYTTAITLREYFPQLVSWNVRIVATDICEEMLERTRTGLYSQQEVSRGLPSALLAKYFTREGLKWRAHAELRKWIDCRKLNLAGRWGIMPRFDIVFMRNVLIYFDQAVKESVLQRTAYNLAPDGYLFLGGGESMVNLNAPFRRETIDRTVCFRPEPQPGSQGRPVSLSQSNW